MRKTRNRRGIIWAVVSCILCLTTITSHAASVKGTLPSGDRVEIEILKTPKLKYPRRAERLGVEGFVLVGFDLSEEGEVLDLRVIESQPRLMFDKSAMKFVQGLLRFDSAQALRDALTAAAWIDNSSPVAGWVAMTVSGGRPSIASMASTRDRSGGTTGKPSVQPCS